MSDRIIIAIDGHSACGKSTLAKDLAREFKYLYVDSGAMYRATAFYFIQNGIDVSDEVGMLSALTEMKLTLHSNYDGESKIFLDHQQLTDQLRTSVVNARVSEISAIKRVRTHLVSIQQQIGQKRGIVMDGRDIGSVVFPDAELKIFLTASLEVRVQRRFLEAKKKDLDMSLSDITTNLRHRDHIDSTREESPLTQTRDAVVIDNTNLTQAEQLAMVVALARLRMH